MKATVVVGSRGYPMAGLARAILRRKDRDAAGSGISLMVGLAQDAGLRRSSVQDLGRMTLYQPDSPFGVGFVSTSRVPRCAAD